jgi:hypothetical protein
VRTLSDFEFFIVAKRDSQISAGIRAKYVLNDLLRDLGCTSRIILNEFSLFETQKYIKDTLKVAIYDESIAGNPLNADLVVRWFLNHPGEVSAASNFYLSNELQFVFSNEINPNLPRLSVNTVNYEFFKDFQEDVQRELVLFYGGKQRALGKIKEVPNGSIEIYRNGKKRQSKNELRELLYRAKWLYLAEDSALALEAAICGCPTIYLTQYFSNPRLNEGRSIGIAKDNSTSSLAAAKKELVHVEDYLENLILNSFSEVAAMVLKVMNAPDSRNPNGFKTRLPSLAVLRSKLGLLKTGIQRNGLNGVFSILKTSIEHKMRHRE